MNQFRSKEDGTHYPLSGKKGLKLTQRHGSTKPEGMKIFPLTPEARDTVKHMPKNSRYLSYEGVNGLFEARKRLIQKVFPSASTSSVMLTPNPLTWLITTEDSKGNMLEQYKVRQISPNEYEMFEFREKWR